MHTPAAPTRTLPGAGFTLLELLVSIGIIAVLMGILAPALQSARNVGRDAVCLSNQRQIAIGWILYTNDHRVFPVAVEGSIFFDWGGVDWYDAEYSSDNYYSVNVADNRPINPYVGSELNEKARAEIFHCPRDTGFLTSDTGEPFYFSWQQEYQNTFNLPFESAESNAKDDGNSVYSIIGNSYRANEWIWAIPGRERGFDGPETNFPSAAYMRFNNTPEIVESPSKFILTGDAGPFLLGRFKNEDWPNSFAYAWWHGFSSGARCNMAFLDGSSRSVVMEQGTGTTSDYSFYITPSWQDENSFIYASFPFGVHDDDDDQSDDGG